MRIFEIEDDIRRKKSKIDKLFLLYLCDPSKVELSGIIIALIEEMYPTPSEGVNKTLLFYKNKLNNDLMNLLRNKNNK
jgi:hypothetical protein